MTNRKPRGKSPRELMLADLKRSGLTAADATKMKCRAYLSEEGDPFYGIPYFSPSGNLRDFYRQRLFVGDQKYSQPKESPQLYFSPLLKGGWKRVVAKPVDVWIGEGEKTSAAACKIGIPCLGIGGIRNWKKKDSDKLISDFDLLPWEGRDVYLCPDSDFNTNGDVRKATFGLAAKLRERGAHVFRVVLPSEINGKPGKVGLDDFIVAHGRKALTAVTKLRADEVTAYGSYPPLERYYNAAQDFDALDIPEREVIVPGVLDRQSLTMIFGPTGIGKSWLAMDLCRALATGTDFLAWPVHAKYRCMLVDGEMPMQMLQHRMRLLKANKLSHFGILPSEPLYLDGCPLNLHELAHQERMNKLLETLESEGKRQDVIVFDNLSSLARGHDENSNTDLDSLLEFFIALRHLGYSVVVVHHAGKSGRQRGASRREDFMDTIIKLTPDDQVSSTSTFNLSFDKTRGTRPEPAELTVALVDKGSEVSVEHRASQHRKWAQWESILRVVRDHEPKSKVEIARHMKVKPQSLNESMKKIAGKGFISLTKPFRLTPQGKTYLGRLEEQAEVKFD